MSQFLVDVSSDSNPYSSPSSSRGLASLCLYHDQQQLKNNLRIFEIIGIEIGIAALTVASIVETVARIIIATLLTPVACCVLSLREKCEKIYRSLGMGLAAICVGVFSLIINVIGKIFNRTILLKVYIDKLLNTHVITLPHTKRHFCEKLLPLFHQRDFSNAEFYEKLKLDKKTSETEIENAINSLEGDWFSDAKSVLGDYKLRKVYDDFGKVGVILFLYFDLYENLPREEYRKIKKTFKETPTYNMLDVLLSKRQSSSYGSSGFSGSSFYDDFDNFGAYSYKSKPSYSSSGYGSSSYSKPSYSSSGYGSSSYSMPDFDDFFKKFFGSKPSGFGSSSTTNTALYITLGLEKTATPDEIKKAYKKLVFQYHPDKKGGDAEKCKEITQAYQVLSDPKKKKKYDLEGIAS